LEEDQDLEASRPPQEDDLIKLCRELNRQGAKYIVIGGMAVIHHGARSIHFIPKAITAGAVRMLANEVINTTLIAVETWPP